MRTASARRVPFWSRTVRAAVAALFLSSVGCVNRMFIIESNVPNAEVYIDNKAVGPAPAYVPFDYYGVYTMTIVYPGFETETKRVHVTAPWYSYPPLDFVAEVLWPFHIHDSRRYIFELHECTRPRIDELINSAEELRQRGNNLPAPEHPAPPKIPAVPPPVPPPPGAVVPPIGPVAPAPGPGTPPVGPQPGAGQPPAVPADPLLPSGTGNPAPVVPLVPSVGPQ